MQVVLDWKVMEILNRPRSPKAQRILEKTTMSKQENMKFWTPNSAIVNANVAGLMGAKITVTTRDGKVEQGVIAGVDPYIGISIVTEDNVERLLFCLHGPFDPNYREMYNNNDSDVRGQLNKRFPICLSYIRRAVETGNLNLNDMFNEWDEIGFSAGGGCPFSA